MNQITIGIFLAKKRKEKNMTQAALAGHLGVSNKTIAKWETGKCMYIIGNVINFFFMTFPINDS